MIRSTQFSKLNSEISIFNKMPINKILRHFHIIYYVIKYVSKIQKYEMYYPF